MFNLASRNVPPGTVRNHAFSIPDSIMPIATTPCAEPDTRPARIGRFPRPAPDWIGLPVRPATLLSTGHSYCPGRCVLATGKKQHGIH